jgi:hypothetical protein
MRALLILAAIILILALVGWISFSKGPDRASVNIESERIRQDTKEAMQSGAEMLHKAGDKVQREANRPPNEAPTNRDVAPVTR